MKRVLVTGATGFLGSHLVRALAARGDEVRATRRTASSLERLHGVESVTWVDALAPIAQLATDVDVLVHAATSYGRGDTASADVERVNLRWPLLLLGAIRPPALFVNVDTSLPRTLSEYARTKRAFADEARAAAVGGRSRVLNVNLESVYGPDDDSAKFQMQLIRSLIRNEPSFPLTPGAQTRDYIFIDDAIDAMLRLIDHAATAGESFIAAGVGRGDGVPIRRFAETAKALSGSTTHLAFGALPYREGELMHAAADVTLAKSLGWSGGRPLEDGL